MKRYELERAIDTVLLRCYGGQEGTWRDHAVEGIMVIIDEHAVDIAVQAHGAGQESAIKDTAVATTSVGESGCTAACAVARRGHSPDCAMDTVITQITQERDKARAGAAVMRKALEGLTPQRGGFISRKVAAINAAVDALEAAAAERSNAEETEWTHGAFTANEIRDFHDGKPVRVR